jgi:hypothetical protein
MKAKMVKSPWPSDIPNGTIGKIQSQEGNWTTVEWSTGHVLRMHAYEIEVTKIKVRTNG